MVAGIDGASSGGVTMYANERLMVAKDVGQRVPISYHLNR